MNIESGDSKLLFGKRDLIKLIIPLIIDQTLALTVGLLDTVMVASAGESAVSGVSLVEFINNLIINLFAALATGGAVVAGHYLGKRDKENGRVAARQLVMATLLFSIVLTLICVTLNGPILSLIYKELEPDVIEHARAYFFITALSYPFIALFSSAAAIFRGMGNSKLAMVNALIMNAVNLIGNSVFIYALNMSAFGAGLATLLARMAAAVSMMLMLRNRNLDIYVRSCSFRNLDIQMIKRILKIGVPNGFENSIFHIGKIILASLIATLGTTAIAANAVASGIAGIALIPGFAVGLAMTSVIAQCVGAKEYTQADYYIKYLMKLAYVFMFIFNAAILLLRAPILSLYRLSPETLNETMRIVIVHGFSAILVWCMSFTLPNAFRAAGDVRYTMFVSILSMGIFRVGFSYLFVYVFGLGVLSVWLAMTIDWTARGVFFALRYLKGGWKDKKII